MKEFEVVVHPPTEEDKEARRIFTTITFHPLTEEERIAGLRALVLVIRFVNPARGAALDEAVNTMRCSRNEGESDYALRRRVATLYGLPDELVLPH